MILYHIMADTGCLPDDVVPQISTNRMKGEDQEIPRICLGHTLDDCLTSIGIAHFVSKFLLAELRQNKKYSKDMPLPFIVRMYNIKDEDPNLLTEEETQKYVADSVVTSECWLTRYENLSKSKSSGLWVVKLFFGPISLTASCTITQSSVTQFGQTAKPCRTRNFRIKSWISLRNGLTKPEKEAHQKLLHILANSIVLKLYDR